MMLKRFAVIGATLLMLLSAFPAKASVASSPSPVVPASHSPTTVSAPEALKAAAWHVVGEVKTDGAPDWTGKRLQVKRAVPAYDVNGQQVSYLVNILADGQPAGYVMVSAFRDEIDPIMMWTTQGQAFQPETVQGELTPQEIAKQDVIWLGGVAFAARFDLNNGISRFVAQKGIFENDTKTNPSGTVHSLPAWYKPPKERNDTARNFWTKILNSSVLKDGASTGKMGQDDPSDGVTDVNPDDWETGYSSVQSGYLSATDGINQKQWKYDGYNSTGCAPTAGSNLMYYWSQNGYPDLDPTNSQSDIVMALRTAMNTYQETDGTGTTYTADVPTGLVSYANDEGYSGANAGNTTMIWSNGKNEIDQGRPFLLHVWGNTYFGGGHTVTGVGYKRYVKCTLCSDSYYLVIRNNWQYDKDAYGNNVTTHNIYIKLNSWTSAQNTWFYPEL